MKKSLNTPYLHITLTTRMPSLQSTNNVQKRKLKVIKNV